VENRRASQLSSTHRLSRSAFACALIVIFVTCVLGPSPARAARLGAVSDATWTGSWTEQDRSTASLVDLGARWAKLTVDWNAAEPSPGQFNESLLAYYDRAIYLTRKAGIRVLMMVSRSPQWARVSNNPESPPGDPAALGRFVGYLAQRWAGWVQAWEIWNEPNTSRFWPSGPNPAAYVALLRAAYTAIKSVDATVKVVFGGVANLDAGSRQFVYDSYAAGAKRYFDTLGWHAYTQCGESPTTIRYTPTGRIARTSFLGYRTIHEDMVNRFGDPKPIWITEFGWSTSTQTCAEAWTSGVSEEIQARNLLSAAALLDQDSYVQVALWYDLRNNFWDSDADTIEARLGLLRTDYSPKPAYDAFRSYVAASTP
jgi:hypothetical protein